MDTIKQCTATLFYSISPRKFKTMEEATVSEQNSKILVAVDGSDESFEVVRYVSESTQPASCEMVLCTVMSKVPEVFWDLGKAAR